jgi:tetratricopeptide (TPR) repeat protein
MAQLTIQQAFDLALQHHQAGRLQEAEKLYRQILAQEPQHCDAIHYLGVIALRSGRNDIAVDLIRRAIALRPNFAEAQSNLGDALRANGQLDEAIAAYRQAIVLLPNYAGNHSNLSDTLREKGQFDDAIAASRQAIGLNPNLPQAHNNLGNALKDKGQLDEAIAALRQAIALDPNLPEAHCNIGNALKAKGQLDEAVAAYRRAIALNPNLPVAHNNLGNALAEKGRLDEAIAAYRQAITLRPDYAEAHNNLGAALADQGRLDDAIAAYRQALELAPRFAEAHNNLGAALAEEGRLNEAIAAYRQAIVLAPNVPETHYNLSFALLARGDFQRGWDEYEWRWKCTDLKFASRNFAQPKWDGSPLGGRAVLLHAEQGFGDTIQFIRYLPLVTQRGGRVIVECQPELQRLLKTMAGEYQIVSRGQPLPAFDFHCPLLSLPRVFGTTLANLPKTLPYRRTEVGDAGSWQHHLVEHFPLAKVGLAWAGNPAHKNNRNRSINLARLAPLGRVPGVRLVSLQKGDAAAEAKAPPSGMELIDRTEELKDFADTAALIANLDLVISVDTAVAHLAGAMGKPVWTLLPFVAEWRWLQEREDSPWYPSMRLFRQSSLGDWDSVITRATDALSDWIKNRG